mgnify:CR=1 FL=1
MPRMNLDRSYLGESERVTVRLGRTELAALDELATEWPGDRSDLVRRALREAVTTTRCRRRAAFEVALPTLTLAQLRVLAGEYRVRGRSRMTKADLEAATRAAVWRQTAPLT